MPETGDSERTTGATFAHYVHILRRRIWLVAVPVIIAPLAAYLFASRQPAQYQATSTVLLSSLNLALSLNGLPSDQSLTTQPDRAATTQANIARAPEVARIAIQLTNAQLTPTEFLHMSSVAPESNANLLDFTVTSRDPTRSMRLAAAYATAFTKYSNGLQTGPLQQALNDVSQRLKTLRTAKQQGSPLYSELVVKQRQIIALQTLQTSGTVVVKTPSSAPQVAPRPKRDAAVGFALGLILALGLAFGAEAFDTRVRSEEAIQEALRLPLLARIPSVGRRGRATSQLSMLDEIGSPQAEAVRMLRTSLAFTALKQDIRLLLITSPRTSDGKTTTVANLGVAFARSGRNVVLCDLDARKPSLAQAFGGVDRRVGLTDVVLGQASLGKALTTIDISGGTFDLGAMNPGRSRTKALSEPAPAAGKLQVLGFGTFAPPDPGEFIATEQVQSLLRDLRDQTDLVIIDSAPMLTVGDTLMLSIGVDAILLVVRATSVRRSDLAEVRRLVETFPAPTIGYALTDTEAPPDMYGYGYVYGSDSSLPPIALDSVKHSSGV